MEKAQVPTTSELSDQQQLALRAMKNGVSVFLTGPAGVGKTTILNEFREHCALTKRKIAVTSTTGVSALLLKGSTLHSWAGIKLGKGSVEQLYGVVTSNKKAAKRWEKVQTLIIDEISMLQPSLLPKLEELARLIRISEATFGGIQIIFSGDFAQLPPVGEEKFCFEMPIWDKIVKQTIYLTEIKRQENADFQKMLLELRLGTVTETTKKALRKRVIKGDLPKVNGIEPTMLYSTNKDVSTKNLKELLTLKKKGRKYKVYQAYTSVTCDEGRLSMRQRELWEAKMDQSCQAPNKLQLTEDSQVMIIANLDLENGVANGTRAIVTELHSDHVMVKLLNGKEIRIDAWKWELESEEITVTKTQIPLITAWSTTIHKCQGSTLDYVALDLGPSIFEYGQGYTALSRVRDIKGLHLTKLQSKRIQAHPKVIELYTKLSSAEFSLDPPSYDEAVKVGSGRGKGERQ